MRSFKSRFRASPFIFVQSKSRFGDFRPFSGKKSNVQDKNRSFGLIMGSIVIGAIGLSYASVPLYRMFCQLTGYGGTVRKGELGEGLSKKSQNQVRPFRVTFNSDVSASLPWKFTPLQSEMIVVPGTTMLAFFRARNDSDYPVVGVSTYNVQPSKAGLHFTKIQCFCFEEQRLGPHEEVDMPVFFYIDPDILDDPQLDDVTDLVLSYTFFKAKTLDGEGDLTLEDLLQSQQSVRKD